MFFNIIGCDLVESKAQVVGALVIVIEAEFVGASKLLVVTIISSQRKM